LIVPPCSSYAKGGRQAAGTLTTIPALGASRRTGARGVRSVSLERGRRRLLWAPSHLEDALAGAAPARGEVTQVVWLSDRAGEGDD
jgi:hypothetical protein